MDPSKLSKPTAAVIITGLGVFGAVLIWAPGSSVTAGLSFAALLVGATMRGLFQGHLVDPGAPPKAGGPTEPAEPPPR